MSIKDEAKAFIENEVKDGEAYQILIDNINGKTIQQEFRR